MTAQIRVTVWNEFWHENPIHWDYVQRSWMSHGYSQESAIEETEGVREIYPDGIHEAIAAPLREQGFPVQTAILDEPEHGLSDAVLEGTDVLIWWGHIVHERFDDAIAERVYRRIVDEGMGFIALHWGAGSKVFQKLMGGRSCSCDAESERRGGTALGDRAGAPNSPRLGDEFRRAANGNLLRAF